MAAAESIAGGSQISRLEYIEREIAVLEHGTKLLDDAPLMESKLEVLKRVRQEIKPKKFTENQLIIRDATKVNRTLPISGEGTEYKQYHVGGNRVLRIPVRTPTLPNLSRADLIYEFHDDEDETVRLALVQYKLWDGTSMPQDPRMAQQLARLRAIGCKSGFCEAPPLVNGRMPYRLPHCAVFLRPTDRLQSPDATSFQVACIFRFVSQMHHGQRTIVAA